MFTSQEVAEEAHLFAVVVRFGLVDLLLDGEALVAVRAEEDVGVPLEPGLTVGAVVHETSELMGSGKTTTQTPLRHEIFPTSSQEPYTLRRRHIAESSLSRVHTALGRG